MFEKLKQVLLERIERDAVKSEMTHTPVSFFSGKKGEPITETVYLKRSKMPLIGDWGRIYPPVNEETMKWNKMNLIFGGTKNLIKFLFIAGIVVMVLFGFSEVFRYATQLEATCMPQIILP